MQEEGKGAGVDTGTEAHEEQSTAGQEKPKVCFPGGRIKASHQVYSGLRGQRRDLQTKSVDEYCLFNVK